jgi:predicted amidohydrolase YtcJ
MVGGIVRPGGGTPAATALAYAHDTVLAVGTDAEVRAISRGDSHVVDLAGRSILPAEGIVLEPGAPASFRVVDASAAVVAVIVDGRVVEGGLQGLH